eukprot:gnl/MRDRNA2_/MRDRNA2_105165_c0_seq1.p1 gnl/MRDRNA2_/MRDRNA2_105165_c0~~gnl/MRDRNA2_/MRDRNA2_105165_c0_seq1.p1  ORF type:complete len:550 (+),score=137.13 gnl/MRDRNA2_/MRDRNA2_105165_c0_seq1:80-1729(+)
MDDGDGPPTKKQKGCRFEDDAKDLFKADRTGVVKSWNKDKGYGFIKPDGGGNEIFVHAKDLHSEMHTKTTYCTRQYGSFGKADDSVVATGLKLMPGDKVSYEKVEGSDGKAKAVAVRIYEYSKKVDDGPVKEGQLFPNQAPKNNAAQAVPFTPPQPAPQGPELPPTTTSPSEKLYKEGGSVIPLQLRGDAFCSRQETTKNKGNTRHLAVVDLVKVGGLLKKPITHVSAPCGLFAVFDGNPFAAELCAKNLHLKILNALTKAETECGEKELKQAVFGALAELDQESRDAQPASEGCGCAVALVTGKSIILGRSGKSGILLCEEKEMSNGGESFGTTHGICPVKMPVVKHLGAGDKGGPPPKLGAIDGVKRTASVGAQTQKHQTDRSGTRIALDDVKVIPLLKAHDFFILGSSEVMTQARHSCLVEAVAKNRTSPKDASIAAAKVALDNRLHGKAAKEQCAWVIAEQNQSGAELSCLVGFLEWDKMEFAPPPPPDKKQKAEVVVQGKKISTNVTGVSLGVGVRKLPQPIAGPGVDKNTHVFGLRIKPTRKT